MRNEEKKENYRNEWKYLISTSENELLKLRLRRANNRINVVEGK